MPYIQKSDRVELDPLIDQLASFVATKTGMAFAGSLNYTITRLMMQVIKNEAGDLRYWVIATVCGVLSNVSSEFYRRMAVPYENRMIEQNGDVDLYAEYEADMGGK